MESKQRKPLTKAQIAELERRGAELGRDIRKHALFYEISVEEILRRWQPDHRQN